MPRPRSVARSDDLTIGNAELAAVFNEIADMLEIPAGTARSRLHYATRGLRDALTAEAELPISGGRLA